MPTLPPLAAADAEIVLAYPFTGRWRVQNSPARRVPSHGTELFGTRYALDFLPVGPDGRSAPLTWRSWLRPEPVTVFVGFGRPVLSPVDGIVVAVHDAEPDHEARRTLIPQLPYAVGQAARARAGGAALAGNHVIIRDHATGLGVLLAHLRAGSVRVDAGARVRVGETVAACGNSGNSTEPHLHLQVNAGPDPARDRPVACAFAGAAGPEVPGEGALVAVGAGVAETR